jgi:hypothetical protein
VLRPHEIGLLTLPAAGTENNDHNPDRVKARRNLFDLAMGTDNLFRAETHKVALRFTITNLTNKVALYNFPSAFSGTHFVPPRVSDVDRVHSKAQTNLPCGANNDS